MKDKIDIGAFCALSNSISWLNWLDGVLPDIHKQYVAKLSGSKGCTANKEATEWAVNEIDRAGKADALMSFLVANYPNIIIPTYVQMLDAPFTISKALSFPRRAIIDESDLKNFIADKLVYDYVKVGNSIYIEYLLDSDKDMASSIPKANWVVRLWRNTQRAVGIRTNI